MCYGRARVAHRAPSAGVQPCGYVSGVRAFTDWCIKHFVVRLGYFTPPFLRIDDIATEFEGFTIRHQENLKSFAWFEAVKSGLGNSPKV